VVTRAGGNEGRRPLPLNRRILQVPGLAKLINNQAAASPSPSSSAGHAAPASPAPAPGTYSSVVTEDSWREVGTEDLAPHPTKHPVLELILRRAREGSRPGQRKDKAKLGLVVEGGGMRGVISGAMLMALHTMGFKDTFDAVYGASAGAINATYFLSGEPHGLKIYGEDLTGTRFIDVRTLLSPAGGIGFMKLDYLVDFVMRKVKPLNWQAVLDSPVPLKVVASSLDELQPLLLERFEDDTDLAQCIKASAAVPKLSGPPVVHRGHRLVDAAVFEPVPVRAALADGCTHVLVLATRPAVQHTTLQKYVRGTVVWAVKKTVLNAPYMSEAWASDLAEEGLVMQQEAELVSTLQQHPEAVRQRMGAYLMPVYPHTTHGCTPLTTTSEVLRAAEAEGWRAMMMLFGRQDLLLKEDPAERLEHARQQQEVNERQAPHAASKPAGGSYGFGARAEQLVRRWLRTGLESKEAVNRQAEGPPELSQASIDKAAPEESQAQAKPIGIHSTMSSLAGDGGDSVLAAAAELAARSGGRSVSRVEGEHRTGAEQGGGTVNASGTAGDKHVGSSGFEN